MIGTTLAHYEIRERLGRGGMGEVFRALDTRLGREVAVKLIPPEVASDPERIARFQREARALAALKHPNIATIHGFEEEAGGRRFLVMELVEGESLAERIARGPLPLDELLPIAIQIAGGLAAAHVKGIVHRDLEAYDLYLRGRAELRKLTEESIAQAQHLFRRSTELDGAFTPAWLGLAEAAMWAYQWFDKTERNVTVAVEASERAITIAPQMAEAHAARGMAAWLRDDAAAAIGAFETAQALDPKLWEAPFFLARVHVTQGRLDEAVTSFRRAADVQPDDYQALGLLTSILSGLGRLDEASEAASRCIAVIERHLRHSPADARAYYLGSGCYSALGNRELALGWARKALEISPRDSGTLYNVACNFIHGGLIEEALELLERAAAVGWGSRAWLEHDPDMDPIRDHPRFRALLDRMGTPPGS